MSHATFKAMDELEQRGEIYVDPLHLQEALEHYFALLHGAAFPLQEEGLELQL